MKLSEMELKTGMVVRYHNSPVLYKVIDITDKGPSVQQLDSNLKKIPEDGKYSYYKHTLAASADINIIFYE